MEILLTGANGFLGSRFIEVYSNYFSLVPTSRRESHYVSAQWAFDVTSETDPKPRLENIECVIHCAARAHVINDSTANPLSEYRKVNVYGTIALASLAAKSGVKRFILISSINALGTSTEAEQPFSHSSQPSPRDPFSISKNESEQAVKDICAEAGMEYVIIRPPLVYGPGVKANFLSLLKWLSRGAPLPLGGIRNNKRSLVYLDNLVDLIRVCIEHPNAANQTFLVSDNHDVSTYELLANTARALNAPLRLLNIPPKWLGFACKLLGKKDIEQRLSASLQVDISHTQLILGWEPPYSMEEGLKHTAEWFKEYRR